MVQTCQFSVTHMSSTSSCLSSIVATSLSLTSIAIENLGSLFLVAHGSIKIFDAIMRWEYANVGGDFDNSLYELFLCVWDGNL